VSTTNIFRAFLELLEEFVYSPMPEIMWPGTQQTPPQSGIWLEPGFFPNVPDNIAWDNDSCVDTRGHFQILVYFRPGTGTVEPTALATALARHFPKGEALGAVRIKKRPWQSLPVAEDASKLFIKVTIPYLGLT